MKLKEVLPSKNKIKKLNDIYYWSKNNDNYLNKDKDSDPIYLISQYFIHPDKTRQSEINIALKKNIDSKLFHSIYLLNEKNYDECQLDSIIIQQIINKRLTYKDTFDFVKNNNLKGYIVLCNNDIIFDETLNNIRKGTLSKCLSVQALLRHDYYTKEIKELVPWSQDAWIFHTNHMVEDYYSTEFCLGYLGCDNKIAYELYTLGYRIYNEPLKIKIYHIHKNKKRGKREKVLHPYLQIEPII